MRQKFFDAHTHVQFAAFKDDADFVIQRALDAGIWTINVGTQKDTSAKAVEFANKYPEGVYATVGLHPIHTERYFHDPQELGLFLNSQEFKNSNGEGFMSREEEFNYDHYKNLATSPKVVAIGECGFDYYRLGEETKEKQEEVFVQQIKLANEVKKPLMVHCRNAFADLIDILQSTNYKLKPSIVHFFSGTKDDAQKLLDMGFSFSFGGVITFTRDYDEVIKFIPLDRILLETDAPYVAPVPHRGKRNEPAYIVETAKRMAELKGASIEAVAQKTFDNAIGVFGIK